MKEVESIFSKYYSNEPFVDKFVECSGNAVDVIIPVIHTNELWEANLRSIYREVPVNRLLISDGGCIDDSIDVVKTFPRVVVYDHKSYVSLGYCLRKLIEAVETEWFIYLHSDVFLPTGWFETMEKHQRDYDWFGCPQRITAMVEYHNVDKMRGEVRPYAGSQMGRKNAFVEGIKKIDDDYVYRQEDYVLAGIVENGGFRHGRIEDTFHYHQVMRKETPWSRKLKQVSVDVEWSSEEAVRSATMQIKGIVKYLEPTSTLKKELEANIIKLMQLNKFDKDEFKNWVEVTNPAWLPYLNFSKIRLSFRLQRIFADLKDFAIRKIL